MSGLRIKTYESLDELAHLRDPINALNTSSRRPCPFATFEYMKAFVAHDEYWSSDDKVFFVAAFEGEQLVGYLPLRKQVDRSLWIPFGRIGMLISHDTDRPHVVARAADEPRCCEAIYQHVVKKERGWSFLELGLQDADSGLVALPPLSALRHYARRSETMPNSTLPLTFRSATEYYRTLPHGYRKTLRHYARRLFSSGNVEFLSCADARARLPLLELYLDLERRSWKRKVGAGIARHPRRLEFFRSLMAPGQPLELDFEMLLLDDLPVAGMVNGTFESVRYGLETSFDENAEDLAPGHTLAFMSILRAVEAGHRAYNFDGNYAYYKSRMGGVVTPTWAVQVFRVGSLPWLRARCGELKRQLRPPPAQATRFNPERRRATPDPAAVDEVDGEISRQREIPRRPPRVEERERARRIFRQLEASGVRLDRVSMIALKEQLPFAPSTEAA